MESAILARGIELDKSVVYLAGNASLELKVFPETDDDAMRKRQFKEAEQKLNETQKEIDGYIQYNDVVYRFCRSSRQAKKVKGDEAKTVKRKIREMVKNRAFS